MTGTSEVGASEAARALGLSREAVVRRILRRDLDGRLIAGRWLVTVASIETYLAQSRSDGGDAA